MKEYDNDIMKRCVKEKRKTASNDEGMTAWQPWWSDWPSDDEQWWCVMIMTAVMKRRKIDDDDDDGMAKY